MKLWQKIFIGTFILFELFFNGITFYLVQSNFNQNLKKEVERGLTEHYILYSTLKSNNEFYREKFPYTGDLITGFLSSTFKDYAQYLDKRGVFIEVLDEKNQVIYNNFPLKFSGKREELQVPLSESRRYIIREIEDKNYLFVTNLLHLDQDNYKLTYIRDISEVYLDRARQYQLYLKTNIVTSLVLAIVLYFLTKYLTRSITLLTQSAQKIAGGDYRERADIDTSDEIGVLGKAFNQMSMAIETKVQELEKTAEMKQQFIESLTHEIKTPLTSIIGYADFLRSTKYNEKNFIESMDYIYREGKRLESISLKLMDLILLGKHDLVLKSEDISEVCLEVKKILKLRLQEKKLRLVLDIKPCKAMIEKELFIVLLTNLIGNSIKASTESSDVYLIAFQNDLEQLVIQVKDTGIGIPEKDIGKVFEPFFMGDKSRSRAYQGAGLGLAISSEIVKLHRGEIEIKSVSGKGTTVEVKIP